MTSRDAEGILRAFLDGEDVDTARLREAMGMWKEQYRSLEQTTGALDEAWNETTKCLRTTVEHLSQVSCLHYDTWHPDEYLLGHLHGEALMARLTSVMLTQVVNAMHLRKAAHVGE